MLSEDELKGVPLLVFCNKQDVEGALKPEEISEQLGLAGGEKSRPWSVRGSCATKGEGLEDGLDWCALLIPSWTLLTLPQASKRHSEEVNIIPPSLVLYQHYNLIFNTPRTFYNLRTSPGVNPSSPRIPATGPCE